MRFEVVSRKSIITSTALMCLCVILVTGCAELDRVDYLARGLETHAILRHATGSGPQNSEVDVSLIYADYYFVEALMRHLEILEDAD